MFWELHLYSPILTLQQIPRVISVRFIYSSYLFTIQHNTPQQPKKTYAMYLLASLGLPFAQGVELSFSWGHFIQTRSSGDWILQQRNGLRPIPSHDVSQKCKSQGK